MATRHFDMTDPELDEAISSYYRWFAEKAPGVAVKETGRLAELWREFDARAAGR